MSAGSFSDATGGLRSAGAGAGASPLASGDFAKREPEARGDAPAPAPDGWLRWRLDQKAAGISLLGLLLGGAGYSLFLPMQSLLGGQVGWVPAGLVVVAAVYLSFFLNHNTIGGATFLWLALGFALVTYCNAFLVLRAFRNLPELAEEETT